MLRLHFTTEDLSRVRLAPRPDAMWETVLSATLLASRRGAAVFGPWRSEISNRLRRLAPWQARLLKSLVPPIGDFPDFLTPPEGTQGFEAGIDAVLSTSRRRIRKEITALAGAPQPARPLVDGGREALERLGETLRDYHQAAVAPYWPRVRELVDADRAVRARALLDDGVHGLLAGLRPALRWRPPVLEANYPVEHDIHLQGRGLLLVPSVFCRHNPVTLIDPNLPPVVVYPAVSRRPGWSVDATGPSGRSLENLLGPTRASALRVIEDGCTTSELARRVGISSPAASQHATALRAAGLVTSMRQGNTVIHTLTSLGAALLQANPR